ncbi:MAG: alpha/beta fold hydrolase [Nitrospirae bacterium]|nr:MAG: alpha/beta fold hydrolase [Nitrospirota bacterium]
MDAQETPVILHDPAGRRISGLLAEPEPRSSSLVVLCHGFLSTKDSSTNRRLTELLTARGISTFRFDWMGMGDSDGPFAHLTIGACLDQLACAIRYVESCGYRHLGLIGSSFGGFIALLAANHYPSLYALGLKCPVPDFPAMLESTLGPAGMAQWQRTHHIPDVTGGSSPIALDYRFYEDCRRYDAFAAAAALTIPVLIVHGEADELVPVSQVQRLAETITGEKRLVILPDANHYFGKPEDFRVMTLHFAEWMHVHIPPRPMDGVPDPHGTRSLPSP